MGRDPRSEDDDEVGFGEFVAEDAPISVDQAIRAAKTAAATGRAPTPQATAKIGKFDLDEALAKSREVDDPSEAPTIAPPAEDPPAEKE